MTGWQTRELNKGGYIIALLLALFFVTSLVYMYFEGRDVSVTHVAIRGAPDAPIVFISDPHLRENNEEYIHGVISRINSLHPALVLIGGDFTFGDGEDLKLQDVWREIDAPVYAVLGNHDYQQGTRGLTLVKTSAAPLSPAQTGHSGNSPGQNNDTTVTYADILAGYLERNGVHVLRNDYSEILVNGTKVMIVGIDDGQAGLANPPELPPHDDFTIYMVHEPEFRGNWNASLVLEGHTHGGQFIPPGLERLVSGGMVVLSGQTERDNTTIFISRGLGTSNFNLQLRAFAGPEIVEITGVPGSK